MMTFAESIHCRSRLKCHLCRDGGAAGRQFRAALGVAEDFVCPFGAEPSPPVRMPAPPAEAKALAAAVDQAKAGLGDQVQALAAAIGADKLAAAWEYLTGRSCGCAGRRAYLNARWPGGWRQVLDRLAR